METVGVKKLNLLFSSFNDLQSSMTRYLQLLHVVRFTVSSAAFGCRISTLSPRCECRHKILFFIYKEH